MATDMTNKLTLFRAQFAVQPSFRVPGETFVENNQALAEFLSNVEDLMSDVEQIHDLTAKISRNHTIILASFDNNAAKQENVRHMESVKTLSRKVHNAMKAMKQTLDSASEKQMHDADFRVKKAQYVTLSHRFTETMAEYNEMQEDYQDKNKEQIRRQIQFTGKSITGPELDVLLEKNNLTLPLLGTEEFRSAQSEVEARQKEIQLLEQNILELRDMFYDIAILVEEQGDTVDRISDQIELAATYVQHGGVELQKAVAYKRSSRKLQLCILFIVLAVLLTIIVVVVAIVVPLAVEK